MDGKDHGPLAMMIVLTARRHLDDIVTSGILNPAEMAEALNTKMRGLKVGFTTMFMSVLKNKRASVVNVGSESLLYRAGTGILHKFPPSGVAPGMFDTSMIRRINPYIAEEISLVPQDVLVAYTDGIFEHEGFELSKVQGLIEANPNPLSVAKGIQNYAASLPKEGSSDDETVVVTVIKQGKI